MNPALRLLLVFGLLVITAHRLPAPIQEVTETPTPTPPVIAPAAAPTPSQPTPAPTPATQAKLKKTSAKEKAKPADSDIAAKPTAHSTSAPPALQGAAKFAGTWAGTIGQPMGAGRVSLSINATGTSVTLAGRERQAVASGDGSSISWHSGLMDGNVWTMTPNKDGKTAHVTLKGGMGGEWSATFTRERLTK